MQILITLEDMCVPDFSVIQQCVFNKSKFFISTTNGFSMHVLQIIKFDTTNKRWS